MAVRVEGQGLREYGEGNRVRVKGFGTVMQRSPPITILLIYIRAVIYKKGYLCNIIVLYCLEQRHLAPGREGEGLGQQAFRTHTQRERENKRPKKRKKMNLLSSLLSRSSRRDLFFSSSVFVMTLTLTLNLTFQP